MVMSVKVINLLVFIVENVFCVGLELKFYSKFR